MKEPSISLTPPPRRPVGLGLARNAASLERTSGQLPNALTLFLGYLEKEASSLDFGLFLRLALRTDTANSSLVKLSASPIKNSGNFLLEFLGD